MLNEALGHGLYRNQARAKQNQSTGPYSGKATP
jgi:hypothetical protein